MKQIKVKNYQSIAKADVDLAPGVNILIGPSDSGKSAFVRAVRDCCFNNTGSGFIRVGQKKTEVEIDDVKWEKSKSVNRYTVGGEIFDKVGRTAPNAAADALGVRDVEFGDGVKRRLQFAFQLDPHFMLAENPADNAKVLGKLADLHVVYNAIREGEKRLKAYNREVAEGNASLEALQEQETDARTDYDRAAQALAELQELDAKISPLIEAVEAMETTAAHCTELTAHTESVRAQSVTPPPPEFFDKAYILQDMLRAQAAREKASSAVEASRRCVLPVPDMKRLDALGTVYGRMQRAVVLRDALCGQVERMRYEKPLIPDVAGMERLHKKLAELVAAGTTMEALRAACGRDRDELDVLKSRGSKIEKELDGIETCPTCGQQWKGAGNGEDHGHRSAG